MESRLFYVGDGIKTMISAIKSHPASVEKYEGLVDDLLRLRNYCYRLRDPLFAFDDVEPLLDVSDTSVLQDRDVYTRKIQEMLEYIPTKYHLDQMEQLFVVINADILHLIEN
jgi:hypothetical protein